MTLDLPRRRMPLAWRALAGGCVTALALSGPIRAAAQAAAPAAPGASAAAELSPSERAQRDADKVFRWILIHSDKPRKPAAAKEAAPVARAKPGARPAAKADDAAPAAADAPVTATAPAARAAAPVQTQTQPTVLDATPITPNPSIPRVAEPMPKAAIDTDPVVGKATPPASDSKTGIAAPKAPAGVDDSADEPLVPISRVDPKMPINLLRSVQKGEVQVRFTVLPDGSVAEPKVAASTNSRLNAPALAAVAQWRFAPLRRAQSGSVELVFQLE